MLFAVTFMCSAFIVPAHAKKDSAELSAIRSLLKDSDREVRLAAAEALSQLGDKESLPAIKAMLSETGDSARLRVAIDLQRLGDEQGLSEIHKILASVPASLRKSKTT